MHIVFITGEYPSLNEKHGGVGTFVKVLAMQLRIREVKVSVVGIYNLSKDESFVEEGIDIYGVAASRWKWGKFYQNSRRLRKALTAIHCKNPIDIVEGAELTFAFFPYNTPYKKVIRMHGGHHFFAVTLGKQPALWRSFQEKQSFKKADSVIAVSNYVGQKTEELVNINEGFKVIYNPIDTNRFYHSDSQKVLPNTLLFIGTVCEKKGVRTLLKAMDKVVDEIPDVVLNIIGRDWFYPDGKSYKAEMQGLMSNTLKEHVHFIGVVPHDELPQWIEKSEVCIYPSLSESFGLTVLEAQSMAKSVLISDIEVFKEIVSEKEAIFFKKGEAIDLSGKLINLLHNKAEAVEMGIRARKNILDRFDIKKIVEENIHYYKTIIES